MQCGQLSILRQWCRRVYRLFKWIPSQCTRPVRRLDIFTALLCVLFDKYSHGKNIWLNIKLVVFVCFLWFLFSISVIIWCLLSVLRPVHTGDYSRRFRRQFVSENGDCRRKRQLSPNSATIAVFGDSVDRTSLSTLATRRFRLSQKTEFGDCGRFWRHSPFSATVWTRL